MLEIVIFKIQPVVLPVAVIDDVLTLREKLELEAAVFKVSVTELAFGSVVALLNISSASTTMEP